MNVKRLSIDVNQHPKKCIIWHLRAGNKTDTKFLLSCMENMTLEDRMIDVDSNQQAEK